MLQAPQGYKKERSNARRKYLFCEAGFVEKPHWIPNCWVNVECPTQDDFDFLEKDLKVPEAFPARHCRYRRTAAYRHRRQLAADHLAYSRRREKQQYLLHHRAYRYHHQQRNHVSVCYRSTDMIPDFIEHTRRKEIVVPNIRVYPTAHLLLGRVVPQIPETDLQRGRAISE